MFEREINHRPSGRIDIFERNGGISFESSSKAHDALLQKEAATASLSVFIMYLATRALNSGGIDLAEGIRKRNKVKLSMGILKTASAFSLVTIGGVLGAASITAVERLGALKKVV